MRIASTRCSGKVARLLVQPYQLAGDDPAIDSTWLLYQVEYATCAKLLNYPDLAGARRRPAAARNRCSHAHAVRQQADVHVQGSPRLSVFPSLEQSESRRRRFATRSSAPCRPRLGNVLARKRRYRRHQGRGCLPCRSGRTYLRYSGFVAIRWQSYSLVLTPSAKFLQGLALLVFCPVPIATPSGQHDAGRPSVGRRRRADDPIRPALTTSSTSTPASTSSWAESNYPGPRPTALDAIALREGIDPGEAVERAEPAPGTGL